MTCRRWAPWLGALFLAGTAACDREGGDGVTSAPASPPNSSVVAADPGPPPEAMCPEGQYPIVAAYDLDDGTFRWVECTPDVEMYVLAAASDDVVWVERMGAQPAILAVDAAAGGMLTDVAPPVAGSADLVDEATAAPPQTEDVQVHGGQDDPLWASSRATGDTVWSAEGHPYYDNLWAFADGAVFVDAWDPTGQVAGSWIAAYELTTGAERWRWSPEDGYGSPWHANDTRLFVLGTDLWVLSTTDATVLWRTEYGAPAGSRPRLFGALANHDTLFVSFTMVASGGD